MSKSKSPSLPAAPSFQSDPNLAWSQDLLKGQSNYLINGLTQDGGNLSGLLGDTVSFNPDISRLAMDSLRAQTSGDYRDQRQNLINTLEANNQLTGSTTGSALGNYEADYLAGLTAAGAEASMLDINRALQNRVNLYGTGLNTAQRVGGSALNNQDQMNQFALQNYENQVYSALNSQPKSRSGMFGALGGAGLGAGIGALLAAPTGGLSLAAGAALGAGIGSGVGNAVFGSSPAGTGIANSFGSLSSGMSGMSSMPGLTSYGGQSIYNPVYSPAQSYSGYGSMNYNSPRFGGITF